MTPNPILKVLFTFKKYKVKSLLIGGQACIIYGAAEFSRDSDFVILCDNDNLERLKKALGELKAEPIYVPPLEARYLEKGHACHFRCKSKDVSDLRIDIISKLRGCGSFDKLWKNRKTVLVENKLSIDIIGLEDLVQSKKTQRDKDWLMLKRLVENDIILHEKNPSQKKIKWWFLDSRNMDSLIKLAKKYPEVLKESVAARPLLSALVNKNMQELERQLHEEELDQRQKDIEYWVPLRKELEALRHSD